jgi:hypothetical protein
LVSRIAELVETLPLPTDFPPPHIQKARRIDWPAEIRAFSETWNNALADYIGEINAGTCALYLWEDGDFSASFSVTRCGRLGWFLNEMRGPDDSAVNPRQRAQIRASRIPVLTHRCSNRRDESDRRDSEILSLTSPLSMSTLNSQVASSFSRMNQQRHSAGNESVRVSRWSNRQEIPDPVS